MSSADHGAAEYDLDGWAQIAGELGVSVWTARRYARDGAPVYVYRRRVRARAAEIRAWFIGEHRRFR